MWQDGELLALFDVVFRVFVGVSTGLGANLFIEQLASLEQDGQIHGAAWLLCLCHALTFFVTSTGTLVMASASF